MTEVSKTGRNGILLQISGGRYFKAVPDGTSHFTTRLVGHNGVFSFREGTEESNASLVQKAGLEPHPNCVPYLAHVKSNKQCKVNAEFLLAGEINLIMNTPNKRKRIDIEDQKHRRGSC